MQILCKSDTRNLVLIPNLAPFFLGFLATSWQIYLMREFCAHFYGNELTFGFVLAAWLLWGAAGSIAAPRIKISSERISRMYSGLILLSCLSFTALRFSRFILGLLPGELTGTFAVLALSLALALVLSFPLGVLFVFNARLFGGDVCRVYLIESLGAASAGLVVYFLLIPFLSNWHGIALIGTVCAAAAFFTFGRKTAPAILTLSFVVLGIFAWLDLPAQRLYWRPFLLATARDSPYGKLQVIKTGEQVTFYSDGYHLFSFPDPAAAEEAVHFAMVQNPGARRVLLAGGGAGGSLEQLLKYPAAEVDYVELDPQILRLARQYLPEDGQQSLNNPRVHIHNRDGRAFLASSPGKYDVILLNLPDPATAQINRFYTIEFFSLVRTKLAPGGIFSFIVSSAENYISDELQGYLGSLFHTLRAVFAEVRVVPGSTNIFLASSIPLPVELDSVAEKIRDLDLRNMYVTAAQLISRLDERRISYLAAKLEEAPRRINRDARPISYFFYSLLWSSQFKGIEARLLRFFSRISLFWLLDLPLILAAVGLAVFYKWKPSSPARFLVPLAAMGFSTIILEIIVIVAFQTSFGYVYKGISLLLTTFMAGLFCGALPAIKKGPARPGALPAVQFGFLGLLLWLRFLLQGRPRPSLFFLFLFALGCFGGCLFVVSNRLFLEARIHYGLGYGIDLLGSFFGALIAASLVIPLAGIRPLLNYLLLFNLVCFLFTLALVGRREGFA